MIIVSGGIETTAENLDEVLKASLEHVRRSRKEPGCICHNVHIDVENQNHLVFFEEWENMSALHAHFSVPESKIFIKLVSALSSTPPSIKIFEASPIAL